MLASEQPLERTACTPQFAALSTGSMVFASITCLAAALAAKPSSHERAHCEAAMLRCRCAHICGTTLHANCNAQATPSPPLPLLSPLFCITASTTLRAPHPKEQVEGEENVVRADGGDEHNLVHARLLRCCQEVERPLPPASPSAVQSI